MTAARTLTSPCLILLLGAGALFPVLLRAEEEPAAPPAAKAEEGHAADPAPGKAPLPEAGESPAPENQKEAEPAAPAPATPAAASAPHASPPVLGTRSVELRFRVDERGAAEIVGYRIHFTLDGGRSWQSQDIAAAGSPVVFQAPRDGRYGLLLSAVDAAGGRGPAPQPGAAPTIEAIVDTTPPAIRLLRPDRPDLVPPDGRVEIEWEVRDENLGPEPVEVAASQDGGPWEAIWTGAPARGKRTWNVPLLPGEVKLRVRARDLGGNSAEEVTSTVLRIAPGEGMVSRWVAAPARSRSRKVTVYYRLARDTEGGFDPVSPDEIRKVEIYYRLEGGLSWTTAGLDPDRRSPAIFEAPADGLFEILVLALDRSGRPVPAGLPVDAQGRPDPNSPPHARVLVDTLEPRVTIEAPAEGGAVSAGAPCPVRYTVEEQNPRVKSTSISSSLDGGATWTVLAEGLDPAPVEGSLARGEFALPIPRIESEKFLLKVEAQDAAGNVGEASTDPRKPIMIRDPGENLSRKADELYRRGVIQLRAADPAERTQAVESFRRALIYKPDHAAAHHDLACALDSEAAAGNAAAGEEALLHFRKAHSLAGDDPRIAFGLVGALLARAQAATGDGSRALFDEAEAVFKKVSWTRIVELGNEDREESQRLRRQYREWKEQHFNRIPR
jgi:hypothetical protein